MPQGMPPEMAGQMPPQGMSQQPMPQSAGLDALPVPDQMFGGPGMASGGLVAFNTGGMASFVDEYKQLLGGIPEGEGTAAYKQYLESMPENLEKQRAQDRNMALVQFGSALAGSSSPYFLQAAGQAGMSTLPSMQKSAADIRAREADAMKGRAALDQSQRGESLKAVEGGIGLYTGAMNRRTQETVAGMQAGKKTNFDKYIETGIKAAQGDEKAKVELEQMNNYFASTRVPNPASLITAELAKNKFSSGIVEKAIAFTEAAIAPMGSQYDAYRIIKDPIEKEIFVKELEQKFAERLTPKSGAGGDDTGGTKDTNEAAGSVIPPGAVQALKANPTPEMINEFNKKFGAGASRSILGR